MANLGSEDKIAVLLSSLGAGIGDTILAQIPKDRGARVTELVRQYRESPPDASVTEQVYDDFVRFFRFAKSEFSREEHKPDLRIHDPGADEHESAEVDDVKESDFVPSDDAVRDLNQLHASQIAAALREENPRTSAIVLKCLDATRAGRVLQDLPTESRGPVFLQMRSQGNTPDNIVQRVVRATVAKACTLDTKRASDPENDAIQKLADLLRAMEQSNRSQLLQSLRDSDPETADKIRGLLYVFEDIRRVTDRCIQKILREVDTATLSRALKNCDEQVSEKVLRNLSKRARATLVEEMEFLGSVKAADQEVARKAICDAMANLDQSGDLETE